MRSFKALLAAMVVVSLAVAVGMSATAVRSLQALNAQAEKVYASKDVTADILPPPLYLIEMRLVASQALEGTMPLEQADRELTRLESEYQARVSYWKEHPPYGLERDLLGAQHSTALRFIAALRHDFWPRLAAGDRMAARAALGEAHAIYLEHRSGVDATVSSSTSFANDMMSGFAATRERTRSLALWGLAAGSAMLLAMFFWVRYRLFAVVGAEPELLAAAASRMAAGDLTHALHTQHAASVAGSMEALRLRFCQLIDATHKSAATVSTAAREIASGTQDLSNRTEQQAGSLEQTAASMEELNGATKHNADTARQATQLAAGATEVAARGGIAVAKVVGTMHEIQSTSRRISEIIVVIDDIAFQTNLLALNAAVEAARAGEHGRGFAVVAGEVGALANRSAQAAREIKSLINTSVQNVDSGSAEVKAAGDTMSEIVEQVKKVNALITEIAQSALEQNEGIGSISRAVMELDQMTQQNAALVEESTAAAISLRDEAARLVGGVSKFQLNAADAAMARTQPQSRTAIAAGRDPLARAA